MFVFFAIVCFGIVAAQQRKRLSIGDQLHRDYGQYFTLPFTRQEAIQMGYQRAANQSSSCTPHYGNMYYLNADHATRDHPLGLGFTNAGQLTSMRINIHGDVPEKLMKLGWWLQGAAMPYLTVSFRDAAASCAATKSPMALGDRIVVNAVLGNKYEYPLTSGEAARAGLVVGSCFAGMGYHSFLDVAGNGTMTWQAENLAPIVPMYNDGEINAIFFTVPTVQQGLFGARGWDGIPLTNYLQCKNSCDDSCTFHGTSFWSTQHIYFRDYKQVTCPGGCTIACCDNQ